MPRMDDKAKKIAYKILGKPENMQKESTSSRKTKRELTYEELRFTR